MLINYNLLWHHFLRITKQPARCTRWRCYCRCLSDATCACRFEDFCFCFSNFPPSVLLCCINFHSHAASVSLWASSCIELSARLPSHNLVRIFVAVAWLHLRFLPSSWLELHHEACQHFRAAILCLVHIHIHMYMWYTCTIYLSIILAFRIARCCSDCRVSLNFKAFAALLPRTLCPYI